MWGLAALAVGLTYRLGRARSGWREGAVAAVLLTFVGVFDDKAFEIRPDGLALVLLLGSWLAFASASRRTLGSGTATALFLGGGLLALATLATQKALFAWPAAFLLVAWLCFFEGAPGPRERARLLVSWVAGLLLPLLLAAVYFASR